VELVHVGSLVVDDIEDGSKVRRGRPSLHHQYGLPVALNAGNWLYFWPLELLRGLGLPKESELLLYRVYHRTLLRAHFGQALDLGLRIDSIEQREVAGVCLSSMELKTGALASFALVMGAILGGASEKLVSSLEEFGHGFGIALQMFDDLGNLNGKAAPSKQFEDLALRRPSWVWACAAQHCSKDDYEKFVTAVRKLPDSQALKDWLREHDLRAKGNDEAHRHFAFTYRKLEVALRETRFSRGSFEQLRKLGRKVAEAYG
jgi:geranylgeranyl pyrophosphate synthase